MKNIGKLLLSILICQAVGIAGALFTTPAIPTWYRTLEKPFFSPPSWLFGPVWTILYLLMGISFFLLWKRGWKKKTSRTAGIYFAVQLFLNGIWSPVFFGLRSPELGFIVILGLWVSIILTIAAIRRVSHTAAALLVPYAMWVSFASFLNAGIAILNP